MKSKWIVLSTGFALFSMFFGSGNLVFPLLVGQESEGHVLLAAAGIVLTGVLVPFLGVLGMMLYKGNLDHFFGCFGKKGFFIFSLLALSLMGPFGVLARCLTVAHGALLLIFPQASLPLTSFGMCMLVFLLSIKKSRIVSLLGSVLTPFLLLAILAIVFFGLKQGVFIEATDLKEWEALKNGFFQGYQTMDLLAAFFFSKFVIKHLYEKCSSDFKEADLLNIFFKSSLIGAGILSAVYVALVLLGWIYAPILSHTPPQEMLGKIAAAALGSFASPCVCFAVIFACLTTSIVLTSLFADFLRTDVLKEKIGHSTALFLTLSIGFCVSTLEFAGIASVLAPILEMIYPALIVLSLVNIICKFWDLNFSHWPFTLMIVIKMCSV